ncbi:hypothetical protein ACFVJ5_04980 [Nocardia sp. NPDC127606]|uniref:hypothetical protein n=1 Tax=Nocardia sp. NPDC127606 TaxID=3345406 RepID=UPI00362A2A79
MAAYRYVSAEDLDDLASSTLRTRPRTALEALLTGATNGPAHQPLTRTNRPAGVDHAVVQHDSPGRLLSLTR